MRCLALAAAAAAAVAATTSASASSPKPGPLLVFLLAGQSNMEGQSPTDSTDPNPGCTGCPHRNGTLAWMVFNETRAEVQAWSSKLVNPDGSWLVLPSVWMWGNENQGTTNWTVGNGVTKNANGPEYGFGYGIAQAAPQQALLAKWARGGTSLAQDWRPPSSGGTVGPLFVESVAAWKSLLTTENLTALYPSYDASAGFEIAGFLWTQGWQDGCSDSMAAEYETNMAHFIADMRAAFNSPKLPFAISVFGVAGFAQSIPRRVEVTQAQFNVANCTLHPELGESVKIRPFRPPIHHRTRPVNCVPRKLIIRTFWPLHTRRLRHGGRHRDARHVARLHGNGGCHQPRVLYSQRAP